jgi:excisionase family DNA binding protein
MTMAEPMYTVEEVAERFKVKDITVREWLRTGKLTGIKTGRLWRIRQEDIEAFITQHLSSGTGEEGQKK